MFQPIRRTILILFLFANSLFGFAQDSSLSFGYVKFQYAYLLPGGDYEDRFGNTNSVGGELGFKTFKNWHFSISGSYLFSRNVKVNNLLSDVINEAGDVTDADGQLVKLIYEMRGQSYYFRIGKVFPIFNSNANSGLLINFGVGYLQHKIKIDYRDGIVYQLDEERIKGYDRLTSGLALNQFIGYQYFGKRNLLNFYLGFEFNQAFTKNRREYNYDERAFDKEAKTDILSGFRFGWVIPFKSRKSEEFYYY